MVELDNMVLSGKWMEWDHVIGIRELSDKNNKYLEMEYCVVWSME